jgi:hypothetical protein
MTPSGTRGVLNGLAGDEGGGLSHGFKAAMPGRMFSSKGTYQN